MTLCILICVGLLVGSIAFGRALLSPPVAPGPTESPKSFLRASNRLATAFAARRPLTSIEVHGNRYVDTDGLLRKLPIPGEPYGAPPPYEDILCDACAILGRPCDRHRKAN